MTLVIRFDESSTKEPLGPIGNVMPVGVIEIALPAGSVSSNNSSVVESRYLFPFSASRVKSERAARMLRDNRSSLDERMVLTTRVKPGPSRASELCLEWI